MRPVSTSVTVPQPPREVFEFLDALANHERFLDHYLTDWKFSGPRRGVGAKARARANSPGSQDWFEFEVVASEPRRIVEQGSSAGGKRKTRGTYRLRAADEGGTRISFELEFLELPHGERLVPFLTRAFAQRVNAKAMRRLAQELRR